MDTFDQFIGIFDDVLTEEYCQRIIDRFEILDKAKMTYTRQKQSNAQTIHKENDVAHLDDNLTNLIMEENSAVLEPFVKSVWMCYQKYLERYGCLSSLSQHNLNSNIQIQRARPTQGYHVWHCEAGNLMHAKRLLVPLLYLNDVEEGGETEFLHQSIRVKPKQGRLVLWPASFTHMHRGNPPLKGDKYIVTSWIDFVS